MSELAEIIRRTVEAGLRGLAVATPGIVQSYDSSTGLAVVRPGVKRVVAPTAPGQVETTESLPDIPAARVVWLGGGGFGAHAPLAAGDKVLLIACDGDPANFFRTGAVSDPQDRREHVFANAIAIPVFDLPDHAESGAMTIGHPDAPVRLTPDGIEVGGDSDAAALASKEDQIGQAIAVLADPTTLPTAITAISGILNAFRAVYPLGIGTVASAKIKTGG